MVVILGRSWLDRLQRSWPDLVKFHTKGEIFRIQNDPISMKEWIVERDQYTRIQMLTMFFSSKKYIFCSGSGKIKSDSCK